MNDVLFLRPTQLSKRHLQSSTGFTFLEVMFVITIIAIGYGTVVFFGFGGKAVLRQEALHFVQHIRYLYQLASTESRYYRIVFDLEKGECSFESSDDPVYVTMDTEDEVAKEEPDATQEDAETPVPESAFAESEDDLLELVTLDADVKIYSIYVEHQLQPVYSGKAYLNFFPRGLTEFAVIQLSNQDETEFMTLAVNPITGTVEVYDEEKDHQTILEEWQD